MKNRIWGVVLGLLISLGSLSAQSGGWVWQNNGSSLTTSTPNNLSAVTIWNKNASGCTLTLKSGAAGTVVGKMCGATFTFTAAALVGVDSITFSGTPSLTGTTTSLIVKSGATTIATFAPTEVNLFSRTKIFNDGTAQWGASFDAGQLTWDGSGAIVQGMSGKSLSLGASADGAKRIVIDTNGNIAIQTATKTFGWANGTYFVPTAAGVLGMTGSAGGTSTGAVVFGGTTPSITAQGANTQKTITAQATTTVTCNSGTSTCTASALIPAGSVVLGVTARVTTALSGASLTTWKIGDGTTTNLWGNTLAIAVDTISDSTTNTFLSSWAPKYYGTATNVVLTANAGQFDAGVVRLTVHYISLAAGAS